MKYLLVHTPPVAPPPGLDTAVLTHVNCAWAGHPDDPNPPKPAEQVVAEILAGGPHIYLHRICGGRYADWTLEQVKPVWEPWIRKVVIGLTDADTSHIETICIDHVRYDARKSEESVKWLTEEFVWALQDATSKAEITMFGTRSADVAFRDPIDLDSLGVVWIRMIGHGDPPRLPLETPAGFAMRAGSAKWDQETGPVVIWWDEDKATPEQFKAAWRLLETIEGVEPRGYWQAMRAALAGRY